ncbi:response regulator [bacterium]|nr:response regulator [bacterium]
MPKILVIEDEESIRNMLRKLFEMSGYSVLEAADGETGCQICRDERPDIIITDIFMPEKEGLETIKDIRRDSPDVKIIAISGGGSRNPHDSLTTNYLSVAAKFGAAYTFEKPFNIEDLLKAVNELAGQTLSPAMKG